MLTGNAPVRPLTGRIPAKWVETVAINTRRTGCESGANGNYFELEAACRGDPIQRSDTGKENGN